MKQEQSEGGGSSGRRVWRGKGSMLYTLQWALKELSITLDEMESH